MKKLFVFLVCLWGTLWSQTNISYNASDIKLAINKLNVLGSVLYVAAHPDDENTAVLAYLSKGRLVHTGYLALTRGDGGQNLIGSETGSLLSVLRTQELLAARRVDGAEQFFTRAIDFGYSKSPQEALRLWDRKTILGDVVRVIRMFKPDVIITRFSETVGGHGHHLASAILADDAFSAAADPSRFPEQVKKYGTWQAKRVLWNTWSPQSDKPVVTVDPGEFNALLGLSYNEIASFSRSMHKSQGFGSTPRRGSSINYFQLTEGVAAQKDLFDGIDLSWKRVPGSAKVQDLVTALIRSFDPERPYASLEQLERLYAEIGTLQPSYWVEQKREEVKEIIRQCSGLWLEAITDDAFKSPGHTIKITLKAINRSPSRVYLNKIEATYLNKAIVPDTLLPYNLEYSKTIEIQLPAKAPFSQPYWLEKQPLATMYDVGPDFHNQPVDPAPVQVKFHIGFAHGDEHFTVPLLHHFNDPTAGEEFQPFSIRPPVSIKIDEPLLLFANDSPRKIHIAVQAESDSINGTLRPVAPKGWSVVPKERSFGGMALNEKKTYVFDVMPSKNAKNGNLEAQAVLNGKIYNKQIVTIDYSHIPQQTVLQPAQSKLENLNIKILPKNIGYIMGTGDEIPQILQELGYKVTLLDNEYLDNGDLSKFDVIICGVRAFNSRAKLPLQQPRLLKYVENGGLWIVQHNTRFGFRVSNIGPYHFSTAHHDRVSQEDAAVEILKPNHPFFNFPNKIGPTDFDGWVQERGLYFADEWDDHYLPLMACHDDGEPSRRGGMLVAKYGKGTFVYTAYAWFRQLPAGVPGALRLFVNMISLK